jgi:hypothetical protein
VLEVGRGPRPALAEEDLLGDEASEADRDRRLDLGARAGEALLLVAVREEPQRLPPLDDQQDLEPPARSDEVRHRGVAGLVRCDRDGVVLGVRNGLLEAELLRQLGLVDVGQLHLLAPTAGYPKSEVIACDSTAPVDGVEETVTAGSSGLSYGASLDEYRYVWKTSHGREPVGSWSSSSRLA